jgi:hypothetical protein
MQDVRNALYLASNSLTDSKNTSGKFNIHYNKPLNLTGKKIALIGATFTKGQSNVMEEEILVDFIAQTNLQIGPSSRINLASRSISKQPKNWNDFFRNFALDMYSSGNSKKRQTLVQTRVKFNGMLHVAEVTLINLSDFDCVVTYLTNMSDGWPAVTYPSNSSAVLLGVTSPVEATQVKLHIKPKQTLKLKFDVSSRRAYSFDLYRTEEFRNSQGLLFQFNILAFASRTPVIRPSVSVRPGPGHFDSIQALLSKINMSPDFKNVGSFSYVAGKVKLQIKAALVGKIKSIRFGGLEHHFGFDESAINFTTNGPTVIAQRPPDMTRGTHNFFIYTSLVQEVHVNEQRVQLLAVLDATAGAYGQQVQHHVRAPVFIDCVEGDQQKVEVRIADDSGNSLGLLQGNTLLTLAVKHK